MLEETPVTQHSPCYSAVSSTLTNTLPDCSNYLPFCHTHYFTPDQYFTSLCRLDPFTKPLRWRLILHCCSTLLQNLVGNSGETQCFEVAERQVSMFLILNFKLLTRFPFVSFLSISILSLLHFSILSLFPLPYPFFLF